jgi:hypothetical protein
LEVLGIPVQLYEPGFLADIILPSITSSTLSTVVLCLEGVQDKEADPQLWKTLDKNLCRLAKQFETVHEKKMTVEIEYGEWETEELLTQFLNISQMPKLDEVAEVSKTANYLNLWTCYSVGSWNAVSL